MGQELENIQHYRARLVNSNESSEAPKSVQQKAIGKSSFYSWFHRQMAIALKLADTVFFWLKWHTR